jgi:hypothetical protein
LPRRLDFRLPDFVRIAWASPEARAAWEPRIAEASRAREVIERLTVASGLRQVALQSVAPEDLVAFSQGLAEHGLVAVPISREGAVEGGYGSAAQPVTPGSAWTYRVAIGRTPEAVGALQKAWGKDDDRVGQLLGYPECCRMFFQRVWCEEGWFDPTARMAEGAPDGPAECNILLRWIGVRAVSHLPCSFDCDASQRVGHNNLWMAETQGYRGAAAWTRELLSWPLRWSSLHGIAEITTPCFRLSVSSDALAQEEWLERQGSMWPSEGAKGTRFPFVKRSDLPVSPEIVHRETANGFATIQAMREAHGPVVEAAVRTLQSRRSAPVFDLGCGDGSLAAEIHRRVPTCQPGGCEIDPDRYRLANARPGTWRMADLHDSLALDPETVLLCSALRLTEGNGQRRQRLIEALRVHPSVLYVYRGGGLEASPEALRRVCREVDLGDPIFISSNGSSVAGVVGGAVEERR